MKPKRYKIVLPPNTTYPNTAWELCRCVGNVFNQMTLAPMSQMERLYRFYGKVTTLKMVA